MGSIGPPNPGRAHPNTPPFGDFWGCIHGTGAASVLYEEEPRLRKDGEAR